MGASTSPNLNSNSNRTKSYRSHRHPSTIHDQHNKLQTEAEDRGWSRMTKQNMSSSFRTTQVKSTSIHNRLSDGFFFRFVIVV